MLRHTLCIALALALAACGKPAATEKASSAPAPVDTGPKAQAQTAQFSIDNAKLEIARNAYVDGIAFRASETALAALTRKPLSSCSRLAILARNSSEVGWLANEMGPLLVVQRNAEHPDGVALEVEDGVTTTLADAVPMLVTEGNTLSIKTALGDAGFGMIKAEDYGAKGEAKLTLDVRLPYSSMASYDALSADASADAQWLRDMVEKAKADTQAVVDASVKVDETDYRSGLSANRWFDILANFGDLSVVANASEADCATLVVRAPGFVGGWREAIIETRGSGAARKVVSADTTEDYMSEGEYVFGRVENATLGRFPLLFGRARDDGKGGIEACFSDKKIGAEPMATLATTQRIVCGRPGAFYELTLAGPGVPAFTLPAGSNPVSNESMDAEFVAGLLRVGETGADRVVVNYRLSNLPPATP